MLNKFVLSALLSLAFVIPAFSVSAESGSTYTVQPNDTMWKIADKYEGVTTLDMIHANPQVSNPDIIYINQVLNVPTSNTSEKQPEKQSEEKPEVSHETAFEQEVIQLTNEARVEHGLKPLKYDWEVARVAEHKSQDMEQLNYFSHNSPTYGSPFDMLDDYGISYMTAGENIAQGYVSPESVVNGWMNSLGHRANILNPDFTHIGIGYVDDGRYWTQIFIGK